MSRGFVSPELEAAWEYLDRFIQANRRNAGKGDEHPSFIKDLRRCRDDIEAADIAIDNNAPMRDER